jgi:pyrimidine operon attenuation protein/uracil phosphoribosyltransferase
MKKTIATSAGIKKLIKNIAKHILVELTNTKSLVLIGIHSRGVPLAMRIAAELQKKTKTTMNLGKLDINLYIDDVHALASQPMVRETEIPFDLNNREVILVDDVLFSGRTIRAALDALIDFGRPKSVKLAVLIDRGNRELPIHPDFVGEKVITTRNQNIKVMLKEVDGNDRVVLED